MNPLLRKIALATMISCIGFTSSFAQLTTSTAQTPAQLVQNVLLGSGVVATNITYTGSAAARGSFNCAGCNVGMANGIILSTGNASGAGGPASGFSSTGLGQPGNSQLNALINGTTFDATVLEFDFSVASNTVQFKYVFASEEYNEYVNTPYNDVFAFYISGPGIVGQQNIALIPGTSTPVSINNVNNGYSTGAASGPCTNCAYFVDNVGGSSVRYDAFTTVLTATAQVQPCEVYHIRLAIADVGDGIYDSAVFLEGNSFSSLGQVPIFANSNPAPVPNNTTMALCPGGTVTLCAASSSNYNWSTGATTQCITVNQPGSYSYFVTVGSTGCFAFSNPVTVILAPPTASITASGSTTLCPGGNVTLTANPGLSYLWSTGATTNSINVTTAGNYTVSVSNGPACSAVSAPVAVTVGMATATITPQASTTICPGTSVVLSANVGASYLWSTGATTQNISASAAGAYTVVVTQTGGCSATSAPVNVSLSLPSATLTPQGPTTFCLGSNVTLAANAGSSYLWSNGANTQNITVNTAGTYTVTVTNAAGCSAASAPATVIVNSTTASLTPLGNTTLCAGTTVGLQANAAASYLWSNGASTQTINPGTAGNYSVTITAANGCTATAGPVAVSISSPTSTIAPQGPTTFCVGSSVVLAANSGSAYLWSNGAITQNITVATAGSYTVTVTNANGCSTASLPVTVVVSSMTSAITPQGPTTFCTGSNVTLAANAGSSYLWSNGANTQNITVNTAGAYTVTVTNATGCSAVSTPANVIVNSATASLTPLGNTILCPGTTVGLQANAAASYVWSNGASTQTINPGIAGNYSVTITDINGCTASAGPVAVSISTPASTISAQGPTTFCVGSNVVLAANTGSAYIWSNGATTQNITTATAGNYTVTVTNSNGCSVASSPVTVNVNSGTAAITPLGPTSFCTGSGVVLAANIGSGYLWSNGATTQNISVNANGSFTVTVTNNNGCIATSTQISTTLLTANASAVAQGPTTFCQGSSVIISANAGNSYLWSNGASTQNINVNQAGNYSVTVVNANGCSAVSNVVVTNVSVPTATATITGSTTICPGGNTSITANAGNSYQWSSGETTQTISAFSAGPYSVIVTNALGCVASSNVVNVSLSVPSAFITPLSPTTICTGETTTLESNVGTAYLWSNGAVTRTITVNSAGLYTVTVTNNDGCTVASDPTLVTVNTASANITPQSPTTFCLGSDVTLSANLGSSYLWSNGSVTPTITTTVAGTYTVTVTNLNGCLAVSAPVNTNVSIPTSVITAQSATTICPGSSVALTANNGSSYLWSTGEITQTINAASAGNYTVTVTNTLGCIEVSQPETVTIETPVAIATPQSAVTFCEGNQVVITANSGSAYLWSNGEVTQSITVDASGNYNVDVTSSIGCLASSNVVVVDVLSATASAIALGPTTFCPGDNVSLTASSGSSYLWSNGEVTQTINVSQPGNYSVQVLNNNGCPANSNLIAVNLSSYPQIALTADKLAGCNPMKVNFISNTITDAGSTYFWDFGDGTTSTASNPSHQYTTPGQYTVYLHVTNSIGCSSEQTVPQMIIVSDSPVADFSIPERDYLQFNSTVRFEDNSVDAAAWHWNFGDSKFDNAQNPIHTFDDAGSYKISLTVVNQYGCTNTHTDELYVTPFYIPNAFTPNNDGINEEFFTVNFEMEIASYQMLIVNRWGDIVFESNNPKIGWRGIGKNNQLLPDGVYVYVMNIKTYNNKMHTYKGNVALLR